MKLADYAETLAYDIAFWLVGVRDPGYPLEQLGGLCLELGEKLRCAAILGLLVDADTDRYCHNLIRSATAWETFLKRCRNEGGSTNHHYASGRVAPLLDALSAGDFVLALRIADASPVDHRPGHEYEDDYCYSKALRCLARGAGGAELDAVLARFEACLDGAESPRLSVCRSLAARDAAAFEVAIERLLVAREGEIEAAKARGQLEEPQVVAQRRVFTEGVALLRLADRLGVATAAEYRMCPGLARRPMRMAFPGE